MLDEALVMVFNFVSRLSEFSFDSVDTAIPKVSNETNHESDANVKIFTIQRLSAFRSGQ